MRTLCNTKSWKTTLLVKRNRDLSTKIMRNTQMPKQNNNMRLNRAEIINNISWSTEVKKNHYIRDSRCVSITKDNNVLFPKRW